MKQLSLDPTPPRLQVFVACLLSFAILITPIAAVAAPSIARIAPAKTTKKTDKTDKPKTSAEEIFVNPPTAPATETSASLPGPKPEPAPEPLAPFFAGNVTASIAASFPAGGDVDADTKADPGDTIKYTVTLTNTGGGDATGLSFNDFLDSHTTFVGGSIKSTPVCFDQAVATNEDVAKAITLTGDDPDGDGITFSILTNPSHGTLNPGVAGASQTYTPTTDYNGPDSFTFRVNDGTTSGAGANGNSNETCTVSITVNAVNDAPTFTVPGNPAASNEDAGAQSVSNFITGVRPGAATDTLENGQTVSFVITNNTNPSLFQTAPALNVTGASYPKTATLTYTAAANQNGTATITYHAHDDGGTSPGVDNSADQTFTITVNAVNDAPVVTPPTGLTAQANMRINGLTGLLANVTDADNGVNGCTPTPFTVTNVSATTPAGGSILNLNASTGQFDFDPPPGATGDVTFTYTVQDSGCPGNATSGAATVHINVAGPVIWFVNPAAGPETGAGTLSSPFKLLSSANTKLGSFGVNQKVFIYTGSTTIGALELLDLKSDNDWLVGQGTVGTGPTPFDTFFGITPPAGTITRPTLSTSAATANGNRPTVRGTVTMRNNTQVTGVNIDVTGAAAGSKGLAGIFTAGTSLVKDVNVTSAGGNGVDFSGAQTVTYITSDATNSPNILSSSSATALSVLNTTIGAGGLNFQSVSAGNNTAAADPAKGISLNNTGAGPFTITGIGTTAGTGGTIQNTTARGAEFISAGSITLKNMTFTNATSVDGGSATVCGIDLINNNNTTCNAPIHLQSISTSATLDRITVNGSAQTGINGFDVRALAMSNVSVTNAGNAVNEHGVVFKNLRGTNTITASTFSSNRSRQLYVINTINDSPNPTPTLSITSSTFSNSTDLQGALFDSYNSGNIVVNVGDDTVGGANTFSNNFSNALQQSVGLGGSMTINIKRNTINHKVSGIVLQAAGVGATSNLTYTIWNNTVVKTDLQTNNGSGAIIVSGTQQHQISGDIRSNTIGNGTAGSGAFCGGGCNGITVDHNDISAAGGGRHDVTIVGNTVRNVDSTGIRAVIGQKSKGNIVITGNLIKDPDGAVFSAIYVQGGIVSADPSCLTATIGGTVVPGAWPSTTANAQNQILGSWDPAGFQSEIFVWRKNGTGGPLNIPGGSAPFATFIAGRNNIPDATGADVTTSGTLANGASCPLMLGEGGILALKAPALVESYFRFGLNSADYEEIDLNSSISTASTVSTALDQQHLDSIVSSAIARWASTGLTQQQVTDLRAIKFDVADLSNTYLGEADANRVLVDRDAQGKGWFIDATPQDDSEFGKASGTRRYTNPSSAPAGHADLLTAIMHEMGHKLGLEDSYTEKDRDNLMYGYLTVGERRLPSNGQAARAVAGSIVGAHFLKLGIPNRANKERAVKAQPKSLVRAFSNKAFSNKIWNDGPRASTALRNAFFAPVVSGGTFPINGTGSGFSLPNLKSTTITFNVTMNAPPNLAGPTNPKVSNHGTLSGAFTNNPVDTNTVDTVVDLYDSSTSLASNANPSNTGQSVTFTATISPTGLPVPPGGTNRTGTVVFKDGGVAIPGCTSQTVSSNQATCTTSGLSTASHNITAEYSGDGNFDPSTSNTVSQSVSKSDTTTAVGTSLNPSLVTQNVTFTATVTSQTSVTGPPAGTINFKDNGTTITGCGAKVLDGTGQATCQTATLDAAGSPHDITAEYVGDGSANGSAKFNPSNGALSPKQTVNKSNTTTLLASSQNPSTPTQNVTFTATVSSSTVVTGPPTGTVTFMDGVNPLVCDNGATATQTLSAGAATCDTNDLTTTTHSITAVYNGDLTFNGNTSNTVSQVVSQTATTTALVSSLNPAAPAVTVTFTATVSTSSGTPTGTVTFTSDGNPLVCDNGATSVQPLSGTTATCDTNDLTEAGSPHSIVAHYDGDTTYSASTSNTVSQQITSCSASVVVTSAADAGAGTLRQAIATGVCTGGTITFDTAGVFATPQTITLTTGELSIARNLTIDGPDAAGNRVTISGGGTSRVFKLQPTFTATIRDVNITGGNSNNGGGIYNDHGTLTVLNVTLSGNAAPVAAGGAIYNDGQTSGSATLNLTNSTLSSNSSSTGGGLYNNGAGGNATVNITNSTLNGNSASDGGAICNEANATFAATLNITNSTISGNKANANGGGLYNAGPGAVATLTSVTITGNVSDNDNNASGTGGGINVAAGTVTLKNTIVAGNVLGGPQVETATVAETTPGTLTAGDAKVIVTAAGMTGSPKTVNVPVATNDSEATVASKIRAGLAADTNVNAFFIVSGSGTAVVLTARTSAANDASMNIDISDGSCVGLTAAPTSADTTPGVVPTAHDIAGTVDAASSYNLIGNAASSGGLTDGGANKNIVGNAGAGTIAINTILNTTLADNGGPTKTHALVNGSPALEKGNAFSLTTDQRGFARPVNYDSVAPVSPYDDTDIGAYEQQLTPGTPGTPDLDAASDTGVSSTDNITSDTSPTFTITGVTPGATVELLRDVSPGTGTQQVETATVVGTIPGSNQVETLTVTTTGDVPLPTGGDASVTVTAVGMTGTPKTILVAVAALDDAAAVAGKIRAAFTADADIGHVTTGFFTVSGTGANVVLTKKTKAANDGTMNVSIDSCTCTGLTAVPNSTNTTPGAASGAGNATVTVTAAGMNNSPKTLNVAVVDGDDASAVAGKMRTALSADPDVSAMFTVSGATDKIVLTAITAAANDTTLNIATANGTNTGLTPDAFSDDTTPGAAGPIVVASGVAAGTSIQLTDPSVAASATPYLYSARQTVSGAPRSPRSASLSVTIDNTSPAAPDAPDLQVASDTGSSSTDNLTNDTSPTFDITNVTNGFTVDLLRDTNPTSGPPVVVATGVASGSSISLTDPSAPAGSYSYTSRQTNGIGNSTSSTSALIVNIDTTPPAAPGTPDLQAGSDTFGPGGTNSDNITGAASRSFDVPGTTVGVRVELYRDTTMVAFGTGNGGTLTLVDTSSPADNAYPYTARQVDDAGNFASSGALNVTLDTTPPAAPGTPDLQAGSDSGVNTDNITNAASRSFNVAGTTAGATVQLFRAGTLVDSTAGGGTVVLTDTSSPGDNTYAYTAKQVDIAGNTSAASTGLDVTLDTTPNAPGTPDLQAASDSGTLDTDNLTGNATHSFDISAQSGDLVELLRNGVAVNSTTAGGASVTLSDSASLADGLYHYSARQTDVAGNIATSADLDVTIDGTKPTVAMTSAVGNPTATTPIPVTVTFSESVSGFTSADIVPGNGTVGNFTGGPTVYTFDLTPAGPGPVTADIAAGVATDTAGNSNTVATQFNRTFDPSALNATITPVAPDPRNTSVSSIQIVFNKAIQPADFTLADLSLKLGAVELLPGTATLTTLDNTTWTLGGLSGMTTAEGTYTLKLTASGSGIKDTANNPLTSDATETWVMDTTAPGVTINQAAGQTDPVTGPTATTIINFTAIFTEPIVLGSFTNADIAISGTAGATVANISQIAPNDGTHFNVAIEGMTQSGTVIVDIPAGAAQDPAGNGNIVGTFTDHTVTFFADNFTAFEVNTTDDSDDGACTPLGGGGADCTLREAINAANADAGAETITFAPALTSGGATTISLQTALPDITTDMTIHGPSAKLLTVERKTGALTNFRIFSITNGPPIPVVTIEGLTITKGLLPNGSLGGGINNNGTLTINNSALSANQIGSGSGAGIYNSGTLTVNNSTINGNQGGANTFGGGLRNDATLIINNSTISGNQTGTTSGGGGIFNGSGSVTLSSSTVTLNSVSTGSGGGISISAGATVIIKNTIVGGGNTAPTGPDIANSGTLNSEGFNLIQSTSGATPINQTLNAGTNIIGDPLLFGLADNGGPTFTHAPQCTSPVIDKGFNFTLTTDQRGGVRPFDLANGIYPNAAAPGDGSDIGAYETQSGGGCQPTAVPPTPQPSTNEDTQVTITLTGTYSQNFPLTFAITQQPGHAPALTPTAPICTFNLSMTCTSTVSYTPSANFNGLDSFKFKVSASGLDSDEAEVVVTVNPVNDAPVASNAAAITDEDTPVDLTLSASDVDSASLTFTVTQPAHGSVVIGAPTCLAGNCSVTATYTPALNFNGNDSFTFKANDGSVDSNVAPASVLVNAVNDAPVLDNTGNMSLNAIDEDIAAASNNGNTVAAIIASAGGDRITDVDVAAVEGLAVIAVDNTNGTWEFSIDSGANWTPFGSPNSANARLLAATAATRVRFQPNANFNGTVNPGLTFRAWDRTTGANGGTADASVVGDATAFSIATETASITVNPIADTPSVTNAVTSVNIQTSSGLVISRNVVDSTETTHFKITNITNGTLFQADGTTQINNDAFITFAQGNAGLKFTPANNLSSPTTFSFDIQASVSNLNAGLGGSTITATITVNCGSTVVTNSNDAGAGSLRAIILSACPGSTITFDMTPGNVTSPITLSSQLTIDKSLTIQGPGANLLTIAGNNTFRLINASGAGSNLSISGLSMTGGGPQAGASGSAIEFSNAGTLTLADLEFFTNSGAGIGVVSVTLSTGFTINSSTFRGNTATVVVKSDRTPMTVVNSTFSGNTGTAIYNSAVGSTVTNSTVADNSTGIQSDSAVCGGCAANVTVTNTLLSNNGNFNLRRTGTATLTSGGRNLIDDATAAAFSAADPTNIIVAAGGALIGPLANNGGPTQTRALLAGSPALDAGSNAAVTNPPFSGVAPFTDQRGAGFARIVDGPDADTTDTVDIGAFEAQLSVEDITDKITNEDTQLQFTFNVGGAANITGITATSSNTTLVPNNAANIAVTGAGSTRTLTINPAADQFGTSTITITVNGANSQTMTDTFTLTVNSVNDVPSFTKGADQTVNEDAGAQTVAGWATNLSVGPANETGQTLAFQVTGNTNPGLFSAGPAISPTGTLTYTPATNINGSATITITLKDSGDTANGGVDTSAPQTFTITVNSVNDVPSFTKGADQTVNEDAGAQTVVGWATNLSVGPANETGQTLTFQVTGNTNPGLFSAAPAISSTGTLTYTPAANANGSATITIVLKDNGGTANGGVDTSAPQTFTITVGAVNDAPVNHVPGPQTIPLNASFVFSAGTGNAIFITDVDAGSDPVQVTLKATDGTITLNGTAGLSFSAGDGTDDQTMTFTGSITSINAALEGMTNLAFGSGVIEITTNDLGHNGIGGALTDIDTIAVTVNDNLPPQLLTAAGTDRAIALDSVNSLRDPFALLNNLNFSSDRRTRIVLFALHAQLKAGETASAITAEADDAGTIIPLTVESVRTVPGFDWLTQVVVKFPNNFATGGGGPQDVKVRITLRGANSNQAVITIVPAPPGQ